MGFVCRPHVEKSWCQFTHSYRTLGSRLNLTQTARRQAVLIAQHFLTWDGHMIGRGLTACQRRLAACRCFAEQHLVIYLLCMYSMAVTYKQLERGNNAACRLRDEWIEVQRIKFGKSILQLSMFSLLLISDIHVYWCSSKRLRHNGDQSRKSQQNVVLLTPGKFRGENSQMSHLIDFSSLACLAGKSKMYPVKFLHATIFPLMVYLCNWKFPQSLPSQIPTYLPILVCLSDYLCELQHCCQT